MTDVEVQGVMTVTQGPASRVTLERVRNPGEFIIDPAASFAAERSRGFLVWLVLGPQFRGELRFPDGKSVVEWSAQPIQDVRITNSQDVLWAFLSAPGARGTIVASELRAVATLFVGDVDVTLRGIHNGQPLPGGVLAPGDRHLEFVDSPVTAWNFYVHQNARLTLIDSTVGEAWGFGGRSRLTLYNSICDGAGGHVRAQGETRLTIEGSTIRSTIVAADDAEIVLRHSRVENSIHAVGRSTIVLVGTEVTGEVNHDPPAVIRRE